MSRREYTQDERRRIVDEARAGVSPTELDAKYGVTFQDILNWSFEAGQASERPAEQARAEPPPEDRLIDDLIRASEFKEVAALFADIYKSSLRLMSEGGTQREDDRKVEHNKAILELAMQQMAEAVDAFDGEVIQFLGDGIYALFGIPRAQEDYALNGCDAGMRMIEMVNTHTVLKAENIQIRVAVCAGRVMAGGTLEKNAFGKPINLSAHLQSLAEPGRVGISAATYALVSGYYNSESRLVPYAKGARPGGPVPNIPVHLLTERSSSATPFSARTRRGLTPFVGREVELAKLRHAMHAAASGRRRAFLISGPAGIGKSRLVREFATQAAGDKWVCTEFAGARDLQKTLYGPIIRELKAWCDVPDEANAAAWRAAITQRAPDVDERQIEALLFAFGIMPDSEEMRTLEPPMARHRAHIALSALLRARCADAPLLMIFEDLQWLDEATLGVLDHISLADSFLRTLLILTQRDATEQIELPPLEGLQLLPIAPLEESRAWAMLNAMLGPDSELNNLKSDLYRLSEGTPLFIEEIVRMLADTGRLAGTPGNYRLFSDGADLPQLPSLILTVFEARVDALLPMDKATLQAAAVLGRTFSAGSLARITGVKMLDLRASFHRLERGGLIACVIDDAGAEDSEESWYRFHHALCHQAVYDGVAPQERRKTHLAALKDLKARYEKRETEVIEELAHHAYEADRWVDAVAYLKAACEAAQRRWANGEAERIFERGLKALAHLPDGPQKQKEALAFRLIVLQSLRPLGKLNRAGHLLRECENLAQSQDHSSRIYVLLQRSVYDWLDGQHRHGLACADHVLTFRDLALPLSVHARFYRGMNLHGLGRFAEAIETLKSVRSDLTGPLAGKRLGWPGDPVSFCDAFLGSALTLTGRRHEARALLDAAAAHAETIAHPYSIAIINDVLAEYHLQTGNPAAAEPLQRRTIKICRDHELFTMHPPAVARLALAETRTGKWKRALARLRNATVSRMCVMGGTYAQGYMLHARAEASAAAGQPVKALLAAGEAEARHRATGTRAALAEILLFRAELLMNRRDGRRAARVAAERARSLARSCGMWPLFERCEDFLSTFHTMRGHVPNKRGKERSARCSTRFMRVTSAIGRSA